jgi:hypothetical protein
MREKKAGDGLDYGWGGEKREGSGEKDGVDGWGYASLMKVCLCACCVDVRYGLVSTRKRKSWYVLSRIAISQQQRKRHQNPSTQALERCKDFQGRDGHGIAGETKSCGYVKSVDY